MHNTRPKFENTVPRARYDATLRGGDRPPSPRQSESAEPVYVSDTLSLRAFLIASSLRCRGLPVSVIHPSAWATSEASMYVVAYDVIGLERVRVLRSRFPCTPILMYSERLSDRRDAIETGADTLVSPDGDALARAIETFRTKPLLTSTLDAHFGERLIPGLSVDPYSYSL